MYSKPPVCTGTKAKAYSTAMSAGTSGFQGCHPWSFRKGLENPIERVFQLLLPTFVNTKVGACRGISDKL